MKTTLLRLTLAALLFSTGTARAQTGEAAPEVRVLAYTNSSSSYREGSQDWNYPEGNRHGGGFLASTEATRYHRYNGGQISTYSAWHTYEGGYGDGDWNYYTASSSGTSWVGPCPATATIFSYWTNSTWWEGMEAAVPDSGQSSSTDTNYVWEPGESRRAWYAENVPNWTLIFDSGPPHQGYFEKWVSYTSVDTTLELFAGGPTNSTEDLTIMVNASVYDNLRGRYLTGNEFTVAGRTPNANNNVFLLMQDNQRTNLVFSFSPTNSLPTNAPPGSYDYTFGAWPVRDVIRIGVDKDRLAGIDLDGTNDLTTAASPHVFWINDDNDTYDNAISEFVDANGASTYSWNRIVNPRDLEDFERLAIRFPSYAYYDTTATWSLRLTAPTSLKLFAAANDSRGHVESLATATQLTQQFIPQGQPGCFLGEANPTLTLPDWVANQALQNLATIYCLFEAGTAGTGALQVEILRNGDVVGRAKVYLKLRPITEMYDHYTAGDTTAQGAAVAGTAQPIGFSQLTGLDDDYILFVHGWRMEPWERRRFAETAFKRLWWQGYKGRFGLFSWPTEWVSTWSVIGIPPLMVLEGRANFNRSELQAWKSGTALGNLLANNLNAGQHAGKVRVFAHSMGNVAMGEALRQLAIDGWTNVVQTYVSCQGAVASHAYDVQATVRTLTMKNPSIPLGELIGADSLTRNIYWAYPVAPGTTYFGVSGFASVASQNIINYRNHRDFALGNWEFNQSVKPDGGYEWSAGNDFFRGSKALGYDANWNPYYYDIVTANLYPIPHHFEIFSHAAEARCYAIGAQPWLTGPFSAEVDLNQPPFSFDDPSGHHSAQFNSSIQVRWSFWEKLFADFFP